MPCAVTCSHGDECAGSRRCGNEDLRLAENGLGCGREASESVGFMVSLQMNNAEAPVMALVAALLILKELTSLVN